MIAHVAEASEGRGRVILHLQAGRLPSEAAITAAVGVAKAFDAGVEGLIVEDPDIFAAADLSEAREISADGSSRGRLRRDGLEREADLAAGAVMRRLAEIAVSDQVALSARTLRETPERALALACSEQGPWNVIALGAPGAAGPQPPLSSLFANVRDVTAVVIAGPHTHRQAGPIVIAVEDIAHLAPMLRAAGRFSLTTSGDIAIALFGNSPAETEWMEGQVRLAVDLGARVALLPLCPDHDAPAIGAYLANCAPGLLIARFGGLAVPGDEDLAELSCALSCPLLLVR